MVISSKGHRIVLSLALAIVVFASNMLVTSTAKAASVNVVDRVFSADNAQKAYASLTAAEKKEFDNLTTPVRTEIVSRTIVPSSTGVAATKCWTGYVKGSKKNLIGKVLFTFYVATKWCAKNKKKVTTVTVQNAGGETSSMGWSYKGVTAKEAGIVNGEGRGYANHKFVLGAGGWNLKTTIVGVRVDGMPDGTAKVGYATDLYMKLVVI